MVTRYLGIPHTLAGECKNLYRGLYREGRN